MNNGTLVFDELLENGLLNSTNYDDFIRVYFENNIIKLYKIKEVVLFSKLRVSDTEEEFSFSLTEDQIISQGFTTNRFNSSKLSDYYYYINFDRDLKSKEIYSLKVIIERK